MCVNALVYHLATESLYIFSAISEIIIAHNSSCTSDNILLASKVCEAVYVRSKDSSGLMLLVNRTLTRMVSLLSDA